MLRDNVIVDSCPEHGPHGDIRLANGGACVGSVHVGQNLLAVHGLDVGHLHFPDDGLHIPNIPLIVIPPGVGGQIADQIGVPVVEPVIHGHNGRLCCNLSAVAVLILRIGKPVPCLWERREVFLHPFPALVCKPGRIAAILPLREAFSAFFTF